MFSSFDDISGVKPYSGSITTTPSKKYKVSNSPRSRETSTAYFVWIIVLLIFCLIATVGISAVLWNELKGFKDEFHLSLAKGLVTESLELEMATVSSNGVDNNEQEDETERNRYLEIQVTLEQLQIKLSELERRGQHLNSFASTCRIWKHIFYRLIKIIVENEQQPQECSCPAGMKGDRGYPGLQVTYNTDLHDWSKFTEAY